MNKYINCRDCKEQYDCERTYLGGCTDGKAWETKAEKDFADGWEEYKAKQKQIEEMYEDFKKYAVENPVVFTYKGLCKYFVEQGYQKESDTAKEILGVILAKEFEKGDYLTDDELHELFKERYGVEVE